MHRLSECNLPAVRKWLWLLLLLGLLAKGYLWWDARNDGFSLDKIQSSMTDDRQWAISSTAQQREEAVNALRQPYIYLGRGFQCYAFESRDGKYVLKFFRQHRLRLSPILEVLPSFPLFGTWRERRLEKLKSRRNSFMTSFKRAQEDIPFEAGLVYTHLNPTENLFSAVEIVDKVGDRYKIEPDRFQFILQYKADHIKPTLLRLAQEKKFDEAKARIEQIFELLATSAKKGIQDRDGALIERNNIGFLKDRAIYIDGGQLIPIDSGRGKEYFVKDLQRLRPLLRWMRHNAPDLVPLFLESKQKALDTF